MKRILCCAMLCMQYTLYMAYFILPRDRVCASAPLLLRTRTPSARRSSNKPTRKIPKHIHSYSYIYPYPYLHTLTHKYCHCVKLNNTSDGMLFFFLSLSHSAFSQLVFIHLDFSLYICINQQYDVSNKYIQRKQMKKNALLFQPH